ncbi:MAG: type II secretion system protein [Planctomycetota bacterium]|nr:type II secretion system protein [Planctomycetota bacterium]
MRRTVNRGFTILELLISILVIGIIMGLVIGGAVAVTRAARTSADRAALSGVKTGLEQFKGEFGFIPPLVRDRATPPLVLTPLGPSDRRLIVYDLTNPADQDLLRAPSTPAPPNNPLLDDRYSTVSLAAYLAGGMDFALNTSPNAPAVDGSGGPALYKPTRDGGFEIPRDVRQGAAATTKRTGTVYESFVNLTKASPRLRPNPATPEDVTLVDANNVPIRYYRWLTGREEPAGSGTYVVEMISDLNVPPMVARDQTLPAFQYMKQKSDRDLNANVATRSAAWAIVSAGPNQVFGDEAIALIAERLGKSQPATVQDELVLRGLAEEDNVVEVGQ